MNHIEKLKKIPHLKLSKVDVQKSIDELGRVEKFYDYQKPGDDETGNKLYSDSWKVVGLYDGSDDPEYAALDTRTFRGKIVEQKNQQLTSLGQNMPETMNIVHSLVEKPYRVRLSRFVPGGHIYWHSHCQYITTDYQFKEYQIGVIHVPLITNPDVLFGVTKFPVTENGINPVWQYYDVGEVWLFNSWHQHNIYNQGNQDRTHIMFYFSLNDPKIVDILKEKIENYDGILIE